MPKWFFKTREPTVLLTGMLRIWCNHIEACELIIAFLGNVIHHFCLSVWLYVWLGSYGPVIPRIIIWTNMVGLESPKLHAKLQGFLFLTSGEGDFEMVFNIHVYGNGGHFGSTNQNHLKKKNWIWHIYKYSGEIWFIFVQAFQNRSHFKWVFMWSWNKIH